MGNLISEFFERLSDWNCFLTFLRKSICIKSGAASGDRGGSDVEEGDQLLVDEEQGEARADHLR